MEYLKIEQIAKSWDISVRRVQLLCAEGKIEGAVRFGRAWMIPKNAKKPVDGRTKAGRSLVNEDMPLPRTSGRLSVSHVHPSIHLFPRDGQ